MSRPSRRAAGFAAALLVAFTPSAAWPGAWTQPQGQGQATLSLYGWSGQASSQSYLHPPRENEVESQLYLEYGLSEQAMLVSSLAVERYAYLAPVDRTYSGPDYSQIGLQYQLGKFDDWTVSLSASFFAPGASRASNPAENGSTGGAAEARALAGRSFSLFGGQAFVDAEFAYRDRTAGPPDEFHADLTLGYKPNDIWTFMLQSFNQISAGRGGPGFPAQTISNEQISVGYALDRHWSLQIGVFGTAISRGTNSERGGMISITRKF